MATALNGTRRRFLRRTAAIGATFGGTAGAGKATRPPADSAAMEHDARPAAI